MPDLVYDAAELERCKTLLICVPGALSRIAIFDPVKAWQANGYGLVCYRFPGLDGRPLSPPLTISGAAQEIAELVRRYPEKPVRLFGYSTGGAIAITAALQMSGDVKVAAMSSAVEGGGGLRTGLTGLYDVLVAASRKLSVSTEEVWLEYYRVLLFGRAVLHDPELAAKADKIIAAHRPKIVMPDGGKPRAHTDDLRTWKLPGGARFTRDTLRFFVGLADPVFSSEQTLAFAEKCGGVPVTGYPGQGHLLFLSSAEVFADVLAFFEGRPIPTEGRAVLA